MPKRFQDGSQIDGAVDYVPGATYCPARWPETGEVCGELAVAMNTSDMGDGCVVRHMRCPAGHTFQAVGRRSAWSRQRRRRIGVMRDMR